MTDTSLTTGTLEPQQIKTGAFQFISVATKSSVLRHLSAVSGVARCVVSHTLCVCGSTDVLTLLFQFP